MKRIFAFVLCLTMLLSQMAMVAEATRASVLSDIIYLEENGITVEEGGEVVMNNTPMGRSDTGEKYAPSVPKFVPKAMYQLGLMTKVESSNNVGVVEEDDPFAPSTENYFRGYINKDEILVYSYAGDDAESMYFRNAMGTEVEFSISASLLWYALSQPVTPEIEYGYIRAEDVTLFAEKTPTKTAYYTDTDTGITVHLPELSGTRELRVASIPATKAPMRNITGLSAGERTLLASYKIGAYTRDGTRMTGETEIRFTLPEFPDVGEHGCYYAECVDAQGNVEELTAYNYLWSNVLYVEAPLDREIFLYSVDYPEDAGLFSLSTEVELYLSEHFDDLNTGRNFSDVLDISFSNPDVVQITPIRNEEGDVVDWKIFALKPFYSLEHFEFLYRDDTSIDWDDPEVVRGGSIGYTSSGTVVWSNWYSSATLTGQYDILATYVNLTHATTVKENTEVTIRVGAAHGNGTNKPKETNLRVGQTITIKGTLNIHIDTGCNDSKVYRFNDSSTNLKGSMLYVNGGRLDCYGAHDSYAPKTGYALKLSGNTLSAARALIHANSGGEVNIFNTHVYNAYNSLADDKYNNEKRGGGIYVTGAETTIKLRDGCKIYSCKATYGGGIYVESGKITMQKTSDRTSASIYIYSNNASNGAGIYMKTGTITKADAVSSSIYSNTASNKGGGFYVFSGTVTCNGTSQMNVYKNTAIYGGGLYLGGTHLNINSDTYAETTNENQQSITLNGSGTGWDIYENTANTTSSGGGGNGGGIMAENCLLYFWANADITNNTAANCGGGILLNSWKHRADTYVYRDIDIYGNQASNQGGGLYVGGSTFSPQEGSSVTISSGTAGDRSDSTPYNRAPYGAGIYLTGGLLEPVGCGITVSYNQASNRGGGIYMNSGTIKWTKTDAVSAYWTVRGNTASVKGGGLYINSGTVTCESGSQMNVYENSAPYGGGAYVGGKGIDDTDASLKSVTFNGSGSGGWDIYSNTATSYNGGGLMVEVCTLTMDSPVDLSHNKANGTTSEGRGGNIFLGGWGVGATLIVKKNLDVYGGTAKDQGGGIHIADTISKLDIQSGTVNVVKGSTNSLGDKENSAPNGGGIYIAGGTLVNSSTLNVNNNKATGGGGGGIHMNGGTFSSTGKVIANNNTATGNGGGIYATAASNISITGNGNEFKSNTATGQGGGLWINNTATTTIKNATISSNTATDGHAGGIIVYRSDSANGSLLLEGCTISNNVCKNGHGYGVNGNTNTDDDRGAGVYIEGISAEIKGCTISGNTTPYGKGGGIFFRSTGKSLLVENCTISNNEAHDTNAYNATKAGHGGGIYVENASSVTVNGSTITGNKCDDRGGGICVDLATSFSIDGNSKAISGNIAGALGGGIYTKVPLTVTNALIGAEGAPNKANGNHGGGIYSHQANVTMSGGSVSYNEATNQGGGIYMYKCALSVSGGTVINNNNTLASHGGGIYSYGGNVTLGSGVSVRNNQTYTSGGGVYICKEEVETQPTLRMESNAEIKDNVALTEGGGGVNLNNAKLELTGSSVICGNFANTHGGGVYLSSGSISVSDTPQIHSNSANLNGGGIYSKVALTLSGSLMIGDASDDTMGNTAIYSHGGGIYCEQDVTLTNVMVCHNKATGTDSNGGGICVVAGKKVTLSGACKVEYNTAKNNGGGVYINTGTITTANAGSVSFTGNYAGALGGALFIAAATVSLKNSVFVDNKAGNNGGGIYCKNTALALDSTNLFDGNMSGADKTGNAISGGSGNGGAIYFFFEEGSGKLTLTTVEMKNNKALRGANMTSGGHGGAISIGKSTLELSGTMNIHDNYAGGNGGAINLDDTTLTVTGGTTTIQANEAGINGGGVYMDEGCSINTASSTATHFTSNYAGNCGGGICLYSATSATLTNAKFQTNAAGYDGGGIYCTGMNLTLNSTNTVDGNRAGTIKASDTVSNIGGRGGGIFFNGSGKTLTLNAVEIQNNVARRVEANKNGHGGAIFVEGCNLSMTGAVKIHDNEADCNGGGINLTNVALTSTAVNSVSPQIYKNTAAQGGGILVENTAAQDWTSISMTIGGASGEGNNATLDGGGIFIHGTTMTFGASVVVKYNRAGQHGGGIYSSGSLTLNKTQTITYNYAGVSVAAKRDESSSASGGNGGGIYFTGSGLVLTLNDVILENNHAYKGTTDTSTGNGGGIYLHSGKISLVTARSYIRKNHAQKNGGGVYVNSGTFETASGSRNSYINNNIADGNGGGLYINTGEAKFDQKCFIQENQAANGGGIFNWDGTVNFNDDMSMRTNTATENGGGIYNNKTFNVTNGTLWLGTWHLPTDNNGLGYGNTAKNGAGIYQNAGTFTFGNQSTKVGLHMADNKASGNGGGIYIKDGTLTFGTSTDSYYIGASYYSDNSKTISVAGNTAVNGAGIFMAGGELAVSCSGNYGLKMAENVATDNGGAIYIGGGKVTVGNGGLHEIGTYVYDPGNGTTVSYEGNKAGGSGGGIYCTGVDLTLNSNVTVKGNHAGATWNDSGALTATTEGGNGGGIYFDGSGKTLKLTTVTLEYNKSWLGTKDGAYTGNGGGVYAKGGAKVQISDCPLICNNTAQRHGGGVAVYECTVEIKNSTVSQNETTYGHAGGIFLKGTDTTAYSLTLTNCTVTENHCLNSNNSASDTDRGAGVFVELANLTVSGGTISKNTTAYGNGGGIYFSATNHALSVSDCTISENEAKACATAAGHGGGIYIDAAKSATISNVTISGNTSHAVSSKASNGGGMFIANVTSGSLSNVTISGNTAGSNGGGIFQSSGTITATGCTIESNYAQWGGGLYMIGGTMTLQENSLIQDHHWRTSAQSATIDNGGGVWMSAGTLKLDSSSVLNNSVNGQGGGVYMKEKAKLEATNGSYISENTAATNGGGIAAVTGSEVSVTLNGSWVLDNHAETGNGGGVYLADGTLSMLDTAKICFCTAGAYGGGLYMTKGTATLSGVASIECNYAMRGAGVYLYGGDMTMEDESRILYNEALVNESAQEGGYGGGVYMSGGTLTVKGQSQITGNVSHVLIRTDEDKTGGAGGGVYMSGGELTVTDTATVNSNTAQTHGGGIYMYNTAVLNLLGGAQILGNTAEAHGGGLYYNGGTVNLPTESGDLVEIRENTALSGGGGLFVNQTLTLTKYLLITENSASGGGGIFVNYSDLVLDGTSVLSNKASNQGGGIKVESGNLTLQGGATVSYNSTITDAGGGSGGGIYAISHLAEDESNRGTVYTITVLDATLQKNRAYGSGGGIIAYDVNVTLGSKDKKAIMLGNVADDNGLENVTGNGGAIQFNKYYVSDSAQWLRPDIGAPVLSVVNAQVSENSASSAGAFRVYDGEFRMTGGEIYENQTTSGGGTIVLSNANTINPEKLAQMNSDVKLEAPQLIISGGKIYDNTVATTGGGVFLQDAAGTISGGEIYGNTAGSHGGGIYVRGTTNGETQSVKGALYITGGSIHDNTALQSGGGVYVYNYGSLTMTGLARSAIRNNTAEVSGNDLFATGSNTTVTISATKDNGADEYWFADYKQSDKITPKNKNVFPSTYKDANGDYIHFGRYNPNVTPLSYARRSFGSAYESNETGATAASTAFLALTLSSTVKSMTLTLTKKLSGSETAVENTTFIFYLRGVDNSNFRLPVAIHLAKGATTGTVTINNLPLGVYDICEDESWSWRYEPSTAASTGTESATFHKSANGDDYIRVVASATASTTPTVTFTNGIENVFWLSDAEYLPFLAPVQSRSLKYGNDEDNEEEPQ